jgi:hypothetical protein
VSDHARAEVLVVVHHHPPWVINVHSKLAVLSDCPEWGVLTTSALPHEGVVSRGLRMTALDLSSPGPPFILRCGWVPPLANVPRCKQWG